MRTRRSRWMAALPAVCGLMLLWQGCGPKIGPRPVLTQVRASKSNSGGISTVWGRVRVHFKDVKPGTGLKGLLEKLNEEVTFEVEAGGTRERYAAALVPTLAEIAQTTDSRWKDQLTVDFLLFPLVPGDGTMRLHVRDYYETGEEDPVVLDLIPSRRSSMPKVVEVQLETVDQNKQRIKAVLDRDAAAGVTLWHQLDKRVHRMDRKGSRLFSREFKKSSEKDHLVVIVEGTDWVSAPVQPTAPRSHEEDEERF